MKNLLVFPIFSILMFALIAPVSAQSVINQSMLLQESERRSKSQKRSDYVGIYEYRDTQRKPGLITLDMDGTATTNKDKELVGTWRFKDDRVYIQWDNGWKDIIQKAGPRYRKMSYEPGVSFAEKPSKVIKIKKI